MRFLTVLSCIMTLLLAGATDGAIRIVRTGTTYSTVQAAVNAAIAGDTIEIDSGTYTGTTATALINKSNLTLRGVGATRPILNANGSSIQGKSIWLPTATNTTVEFIEFTNCTVPDNNGAGIKLDGTTLTVRNCYFRDNQNGILTVANTSSDVLVENCEFNHNGYGDGYTHNIYIGTVGTFTARHNYFHHANRGQEIKTRAKVNYILCNRITCEDGYSNYEIDVPNGGTTYIIGNLIHQGPNTTNSTIVNYAAEGATNPDQHFYVVNNTLVNTRGTGTFVYNRQTSGVALLQNNIFQGTGTVVAGSGTTTQVTNWVTSNAYLANPSAFDYHLTGSSTGAINTGTTPGTGINGFNMNPTLQYVHPRSSETRPVSGGIDIGAYEYYTAPANQAPAVNAGTDQSIRLPTNSVNLDGTVTDDGLPDPPAAVTLTWSCIAGPGTVTFGNAHAADTTATFSVAGTYTLQLHAYDGALSDADTCVITVQSAAVTATFQNGVLPDATYAGCDDTWISGGAAYVNVNYGNNTWGNGIGQYAGTKRSLIKFSLSSVPAGATVTAAKIRLKMSKVDGARTLEAYQVLLPWTRLGCTWNRYDGTIAWYSAGCSSTGYDRAASAAGSVNVVTADVNNWIEIPLATALVQGWVSGATSNHGVLLKVTNEASYEMRYRAENYTSAADRPQFVITYTTD